VERDPGVFRSHQQLYCGVRATHPVRSSTPFTKSGVNDFHGTGFFLIETRSLMPRISFDPAGPFPLSGAFSLAVRGKGYRQGQDICVLERMRESVRLSLCPSPSVCDARGPQRHAMRCVGGNPCASLRTVAVDPRSCRILLCAMSGRIRVSNPRAIWTSLSLNVSLPGISKEDYVYGRVDQKISDKDNLSGSYFFDSGPLTSRIRYSTPRIASSRGDRWPAPRKRIFSVRS